MKKSGHGTRCIDLDDAVQVTHVYTQLQGAGGDNDAITGFGEGSLGELAGLRAQAAMGSVGLDLAFPEQVSQLFHRARLSQNTRRFSPECSDAMTWAAFSRFST